MVTSTQLNSRQRTIVSVAWLSYASYYLGRVNISVVIPALEAELGFSKSQAGWLLTGFFLIYGVSALVNGRLGDSLSPRNFVFVGMLVSANLNLLFGFSSIWTMLFAIWILNGYFQATGWGPILRTLANWLTYTQRSKISGAFGTSFVAGNAVTWLLAGWLVTQFGWRWAFWLPGFLLLSMAFVWHRVIRDAPESTPVRSAKREVLELAVFWQGLKGSFHRFWVLSLVALLTGFIFGVFTLWTPSYFVDVGNVSIRMGSSVAALLPIAGIVGIFLVGWFVGRYFVKRELIALLAVLFALSSVSTIFPFFAFRLESALAILMFMASLAYSATTIILATLPLTVETETSSTAGLFDFSFSVGTALSGIIIGLLLDWFGWNIVFTALAIAGFTAVFLVVLAAKTLKSSS